jgi:hypothetical protein
VTNGRIGSDDSATASPSQRHGITGRKEFTVSSVHQIAAKQAHAEADIQPTAHASERGGSEIVIVVGVVAVVSMVFGFVIGLMF